MSSEYDASTSSQDNSLSGSIKESTRHYKCIMCGTKTGKAVPSIRLHRFPKNEELSEKWAKYSGLKFVMKESTLTRYSRYRICSNHFLETDYNGSYRLRKTAVPTVNGNCSDVNIPTMQECLRQKLDNNITSQDEAKMPLVSTDVDRDVRNCWKNLRQEFGKQLKKRENRPADAAFDNGNCHWPYFEKLLFLHDQFATRDKSGCTTSRPDDFLPVILSTNTADDDSNSDGSVCFNDGNGMTFKTSPSSVPDHESLLAVTPIDLPTPSSSHAASHPECSATKTAFKRRLIPEVVEGEEQLIDSETEEQLKKKNKYDDEDLGFFNSLLPHVQRLSPKDKFIFRMKTQRVLFELAFPE